MAKSKKKEALKKTNAMRILDQKNIDYNVYDYEVDDAIDGVSVALKTKQRMERVFKTIVLQSGTHYYVALIPVDKHINLKACARAFGVKRLELLHVRELFDLTGYVRGGCSPIGMKKQFPTVIDQSASNLDAICFSGGRIGSQIELNAQLLAKLINSTFASITEENEEA